MFRMLAYAQTVVAVVGLQPARAQPLEATSDARPNIVLILADDLGWMDLGCQGSRYYQSPHIDQLARDGMRFTNAYAACAVCSPSRYAVLTGRYPARSGVTDWLRGRWNRDHRPLTAKDRPPDYPAESDRKLLCPNIMYWMDHDEVTFAELLAAEGYATCHIGKWHLGGRLWHPETQGFAINIGGCDFGLPASYFDPYQSTVDGHAYKIANLPSRKPGEYLTDREADEAVRFIEANKDQPFVLYYAPYAVHDPITAKPDMVKKYEALPKRGQKNAAYAAMIESLDNAVGKIVKELERLKLADNTLVIFTSDNGGEQDYTVNAPLRGEKGNCWEGGLRVPLVVRWPGVVPSATVSSEPVTGVDYLPTLREAAGVEQPLSRAIDGVSLVAHLRSGGREALSRDAIFWHYPHYRYSSGSEQVRPYAALRAGDYKLVRWFEGNQLELYDLAEDLGETRNLAAERPKVAQKLNQRLDQFLAETKARLPKNNPAFDTSVEYTVDETEDRISIETPELSAAIRKKGYVSGVMAGSLVDKKTGARELGFGLDIVDWIMEPGPDNAYRDRLDKELIYLYGPGPLRFAHGDRPKRCLEGPQICTQARELKPTVVPRKNFVAVEQKYQYRTAAPGKKTGSTWLQRLVFPRGERYFVSMDQISAVNDSEAMFLRIDMPGHLKHKQGDSFSEIYLSYHGVIPSSEFVEDFPPDARFNYRRDCDGVPKRMIRAYHIRDAKTGQDGPWLAGMTLDPSVVHEAWCHQRGYVCMIEEFGGRPIKAGQSFRAAFIVGYFDSIDEMHKVYDRYKGHTRLELTDDGWQLGN